MKNREKINRLSDQELAEFICDSITDCYFCEGNGLCTMDGDHANGLAKWLETETVWTKNKAQKETDDG